jgi:hypothetical protein
MASTRTLPVEETCGVQSSVAFTPQELALLVDDVVDAAAEESLLSVVPQAVSAAPAQQVATTAVSPVLKCTSVSPLPSCTLRILARQDPNESGVQRQ